MTHFLSDDVVRHPLVQKIINAYEQHGEAAAERAAESGKRNGKPASNE